MNQYKPFDLELRLDHKIALITGAASGIANATAKMMSKKGATVIMADIDPQVVEAAKEVERATAVVVDITDYAQLEKTVDSLTKTVGDIDILCNIAGLGSGTPAEEISKDEFDRVLKVNLCGAFYLSQIVGRKMIAGGRGRTPGSRGVFRLKGWPEGDHQRHGPGVGEVWDHGKHGRAHGRDDANGARLLERRARHGASCADPGGQICGNG